MASQPATVAPPPGRATLRADVVAGLVTSAVVIPKAMAYATIAGLPVEVGLYTALVPAVIYAVLGTSRPLSVSTTTTIAILTGAQLGLAVPGGEPARLLAATATLALLVGGILVAASALRLGFVANFISEPVLLGFKAGIGLVIVVDQVPKLLGIHFAKGSFVANVGSIVRGAPGTSLATLLLAVGTILFLVALERWAPRLPAPLVGVATGIAGVAFLGWRGRGIEVIGNVPVGLPSLTLPDPSLVALLWPGALGIALMSFTETVAAGRAFQSPDEPALRPNRELLATGLAGAGGAFLGAMPSGGGTSQTALNRRVGARTQVASLVTAGATLLTMFALAPLMGMMPQATLAAVVIVYSVGLIQPAEILDILRVRRAEFTWALAALAGVVLLGTLKGILVAIVVSMVALAYQVTHAPVHVLGRKPGTNVFRPVTPEHPEDETFPGLLLLRIEGRIFFLNAADLAARVQALVAEARPEVVVVDLSAVFDLEYTAVRMFTEGERRQREAGVSFWLVGLNPGVYQVVLRSPLGRTLGRERMFFNLEAAVAAWQARPRERVLA